MLYCGLLLKSAMKNNVWLISDKHTGHFCIVDKTYVVNNMKETSPLCFHGNTFNIRLSFLCKWYTGKMTSNKGVKDSKDPQQVSQCHAKRTLPNLFENFTDEENQDGFSSKTTQALLRVPCGLLVHPISCHVPITCGEVLNDNGFYLLTYLLFIYLFLLVIRKTTTFKITIPTKTMAR